MRKPRSPVLVEEMLKLDTEAVVWRCSVEKLFLEILKNSQKNNCAGVSFLIKLQALAQVFFCEFCEISKNTFFNRTPPVAASVVDTLKTSWKYFIDTGKWISNKHEVFEECVNNIRDCSKRRWFKEKLLFIYYARYNTCHHVYLINLKVLKLLKKFCKRFDN